MSVLEKLLMVSNGIKDAYQNETEVLKYIVQKAEESGSDFAKLAASLFVDPEQKLTRPGPVLDMIRRNLWPNRQYISELAADLGDGTNKTDMDKVRERIKATAKKEGEMAGKKGQTYGSALITEVLSTIDISDKTLFVTLKGMDMLNQICIKMSKIEKWKENGPSVYRLHN